ncbi:LPXTG cell wall anchor domain-containing protein [Glycomyces sp. A-F 0318]|uniref:LPXTG cell wall anchor domain-containing protein n=1 Tax=Glycomyces amatae TaxID=2881355 RepID=UPI001E3973FC|nr:LPXTG cell wall anchor domain-containing protein [Glycomyces amatae]MCD0444482.1 LPXTG cell wall anchor domain-containing protein [Glycomyces amatae]
MNRTLKRVLGVTGSVMLGVAGAVTFASAAQAHHPQIDGVAECTDDGGWTVTWNVYDWSGNTDKIGEITQIDGSLDAGGQIVEGATLSDTALVGTQTLTADQTSAAITVHAEWTKNGKVKATGETDGYVTIPAGGCESETPVEPEPEPNFSVWSDCFGVSVVAANLNEEALSEFTITPSAGDEIVVTPAFGEEYAAYFPVEDAEAGLSVDIAIDGEVVQTYDWAPDGTCEWGFIYDTCDGLEFELTIPEDGEETTFTFTPSNSDEPIVVVVVPGTTETVTIPAVDNEEFSVHYLIETPKDAYEGETPWIPCDEESPAPSETPSAQPQLPTTGSSLTIMISSAAALILAAGIIFMVMRRRRAAQDW